MLKMPQAWSQTQVKASSTEVSAKLDMSAEVAGQGVCPDCKSPMERVFHGDVEVFTCAPCRVVLPIKDEQAEA